MKCCIWHFYNILEYVKILKLLKSCVQAKHIRAPRTNKSCEKSKYFQRKKIYWGLAHESNWEPQHLFHPCLSGEFSHNIKIPPAVVCLVIRVFFYCTFGWFGVCAEEAPTPFHFGGSAQKLLVKSIIRNITHAPLRVSLIWLKKSIEFYN